MTEQEKMLSGLPFDGMDSALSEMRRRADELCRAYNGTDDNSERLAILQSLLGGNCENVTFQGPLYFTYGKNSRFGEGFYANFNLTVLDHGGVTVGKHVMFGPNCTLVTVNHPIHWEDRRVRTRLDGSSYDVETAAPIRIGDDCWLGAGVTVCPGVTIGEGTVIAAGSVVCTDIPQYVLAAGVPCRVLREITEEDRLA